MYSTNKEINQISPSSLIEDLKTGDTKIKINALRNLELIAFALGKERTRNELLPFLSECIDEEDDEVLIELAKALGSFLDNVGGVTFAGYLFKILENLITLDETNVRTQALNSFESLLSKVNIQSYENDLVQLISKLSTSDYVSHKQSAIYLIGIVFQSTSKTNRMTYLSIINKCILDQSLLVRKEAGLHLAKYASLIDEETIFKFLKILSKDEQDAVRIPVLDIIIGLKGASYLNKAADGIQAVIKLLSKDESWRVRYTTAEKMTSLLDLAASMPLFTNFLIDLITDLLQDNEPEIRNSCCLNLYNIIRKTNQNQNVDKILKQLKSIEKDSSHYVRASLASNILKISPLIGKTKTNDFIFPIFLNLIKDENHDIRMTLVKTLDKLHEVIPIDIYVQSIIPSIIEIANNKQWRIRIQVAESIPIFAKILESFIENLLQICIDSLTDPVFALRESACGVLRDVFTSYQSEDLDKHLFGKLTEMKQSPSYLVRNTVILLCSYFCVEQQLAVFTEKALVPLIVEMSKDKISNCRMNAAKVLRKMLQTLTDKGLIVEVQGALRALSKDKDIDVVNAASN